MKWSRTLAILSLAGCLTGCWTACLTLTCGTAWAGHAPGYGKITGAVFDAGGTPQMGVRVWLTPEAAGGRTAARLLTDQNGIFTSPELRPGLYSLRANLAGFLPTVQRVRIGADFITLVRVQLDSVFSSLDNLRRQQSAQPSERDDWKWVLRTSAASRPVLQLVDGTLVVREGPAESNAARRPDRARVEMTNGSVLPGSPSADSGTLGTAAAYDQGLGVAGRLLVAGQMAYDSAATDSTAISGAAASIWLPRGDWNEGPETIAILHQGERVGNLPAARTVRIEHAEQMTITDHLMLRYAGDLVMGGIGGMTASIRPGVQLAWRPSSPWSASLALETDPQSSILARDDGRLQSAIDALSTTPVMIWRDGQVSSLQGGWHEEASVRRTIGARGRLEGAAFHDFFEHQAVFGVDGTPDPNIPQSLLGEAYAHDAGPGGSWGTRVVYSEKLTDHLEVAAIYTWAGALTPETLISDLPLGNSLAMTYHHSVAGRISAKVPRTGTIFAASYKWIDGATVGRQDLFGEAALGIDPYLSFTLRQRLPAFLSNHWEAICSFRNVLAQGYLPLTTQEGKFVSTPVERSLQGGVSVQF